MSENDKILDHDYDGIQEYDNDLPKWWIALFILTTIYGVYYAVQLHIGDGLDQIALLEKEMAAYEKQAEITEAKQPKKELSSDELLALLNNEENMLKAKEVYIAKCAACHLAEGQGLVGPNLTDDYWLHGGSILDIYNVIVEGVPAKGMIAWRNLLSEEEIRGLSAYIWNLHGTNPPNPKAPQGELAPRN